MRRMDSMTCTNICSERQQSPSPRDDLMCRIRCKMQGDEKSTGQIFTERVRITKQGVQFGGKTTPSEEYSSVLYDLETDLQTEPDPSGQLGPRPPRVIGPMGHCGSARGRSCGPIWLLSSSKTSVYTALPDRESPLQRMVQMDPFHWCTWP